MPRLVKMKEKVAKRLSRKKNAQIGNTFYAEFAHFLPELIIIEKITARERFTISHYDSLVLLFLGADFNDHWTAL